MPLEHKDGETLVGIMCISCGERGQADNIELGKHARRKRDEGIEPYLERVLTVDHKHIRLLADTFMNLHRGHTLDTCVMIDVAMPGSAVFR